MNSVKKEVTLNVFFCGTSGTVQDETTLIGTFAKNTIAKDITKTAIKRKSTGTQYKMAFNGCGVAVSNDGSVEPDLLGALFAVGLEEQCDKVVAQIRHFFSLGKKVRLNCVGLSRGGMACLLLAKKLAGYDLNHLETNMLLFDPVPGNLIISGQLDLAGNTLVNQCFDVSHSRNLQHALALYPHEPLPDYAFHAPVLPKYPDSCHVEENIILGCHQGALMGSDSCLDKILSYVNIKGFLEGHGATVANFMSVQSNIVLPRLNSENKQAKNSERATHSENGVMIIRDTNGTYLNRFHEKLAKEQNKEKEAESVTYSLRMQPARLFNKPSKPIAVTKKQLLSFIDQIKQGMSDTSLNSEKGSILQRKHDQLNQSAITDQQQDKLSFVLRDVLAISLQRDRNPLTFFHTIKSGWVIKDLLETNQFSAIKQMIVPGSAKMRYRDLRIFVYSRNREEAFDLSMRDITYKAFGNNPIGQDYWDLSLRGANNAR